MYIYIYIEHIYIYIYRTYIYIYQYIIYKYIYKHTMHTPHTPGIHKQIPPSPHYILTICILISKSLCFIVADDLKFPIFS